MHLTQFQHIYKFPFFDDIKQSVMQYRDAISVTDRHTDAYAVATKYRMFLLKDRIHKAVHSYNNALESLSQDLKVIDSLTFITTMHLMYGNDPNNLVIADWLNVFAQFPELRMPTQLNQRKITTAQVLLYLYANCISITHNLHDVHTSIPLHLFTARRHTHTKQLGVLMKTMPFVAFTPTGIDLKLHTYIRQAYTNDIPQFATFSKQAAAYTLVRNDLHAPVPLHQAQAIWELVDD